MEIPFNRPYLVGTELDNIAAAHKLGQLAGDGTFTARCQRNLQAVIKTPKALLTHSCTAALEISAYDDLEDGDSHNAIVHIVSTAGMYSASETMLVDRPDTLNIDESLIPRAITDKTRAIVPVHYAGVCDMDIIMKTRRILKFTS